MNPNLYLLQSTTDSEHLFCGNRVKLLDCKQCSASFCLRIFSGFDVCFWRLPFVLGFCHSIVAILTCASVVDQRCCSSVMKLTGQLAIVMKLTLHKLSHEIDKPFSLVMKLTGYYTETYFEKQLIMAVSPNIGCPDRVHWMNPEDIVHNYAMIAHSSNCCLLLLSNNDLQSVYRSNSLSAPGVNLHPLLNSSMIWLLVIALLYKIKG